MVFKHSNPRAARAAFTLVEMLVASGIGAVLLLFASSFYLFSLRSFTSLANYTDLSMKSRYASDLISRDLRSALSVQNVTSNQLVLNLVGGVTTVTYTYDPVSGRLTRDDGRQSQVLLTQIAPGSFNIAFYGPPTNNVYESFPVSAANRAKLVGFKWACNRPVLTGSLTNSQTLEMALVNLRNQ
jgi:prepilin-type N-terminal cleavage/methylation domain-containing protein